MNRWPEKDNPVQLWGMTIVMIASVIGVLYFVLETVLPETCAPTFLFPARAESHSNAEIIASPNYFGTGPVLISTGVSMGEWHQVKLPDGSLGWINKDCDEGVMNLWERLTR